MRCHRDHPMGYPGAPQPVDVLPLFTPMAGHAAPAMDKRSRSPFGTLPAGAVAHLGLRPSFSLEHAHTGAQLLHIVPSAEVATGRRRDRSLPDRH